jgi:hypothetical protein
VLAGGVTFRAKFHSKSLYSVEKKIVGISQYAYFSCLYLYCFFKKGFPAVLDDLTSAFFHPLHGMSIGFA